MRRNDEEIEVFNPKDEQSSREISQSRILSNSSQDDGPSMKRNKDLFGDDHKQQELGQIVEYIPHEHHAYDDGDRQIDDNDPLKLRDDNLLTDGPDDMKKQEDVSPW